MFCRGATGRSARGMSSSRARQVSGCALTDAGALVCWGAFPVTDPGPYAAVSSVGAAICAVAEAGEITCWNVGGAPPGSYSAVSAGGTHIEIHFCALTEEGKAVCWAQGSIGRTVLRPPDPAPGRYTAISVGVEYACCPDGGGRGVCWDAEWAIVLPPDPPPGRYVTVSDGTYHTCALTEAGEAVCWGGARAGKRSRRRTLPAISAGWSYTCAVTEAGEAVCWGENFHGQSSPPPGRYTAISADLWNTCALTEVGAAVCWGGYLGGPLPGRYTAISAGYPPCALSDTGEQGMRGCGRRGSEVARR